MTTLTTEQFQRRFKPQINHLNSDAFWGGRMYATDGEEFEYVQTISLNRIWTVYQDDQGGNVVLKNGLKADHLGYVICELPFKDDELIVVMEDVSDIKKVGDLISETCPFCGGYTGIEVIGYDDTSDRSTLFCTDCGEEFEIRCE